MSRTSPLDPAASIASTTVLVEEDDRDASRFKTVHASTCKGCKDPEPVEVCGTVEDLLVTLEGYDVALDVKELSRHLMPCARQALGL